MYFTLNFANIEDFQNCFQVFVSIMQCRNVVQNIQICGYSVITPTRYMVVLVIPHSSENQKLINLEVMHVHV